MSLDSPSFCHDVADASTMCARHIHNACKTNYSLLQSRPDHVTNETMLLTDIVAPHHQQHREWFPFSNVPWLSKPSRPQSFSKQQPQSFWMQAWLEIQKIVCQCSNKRLHLKCNQNKINIATTLQLQNLTKSAPWSCKCASRKFCNAICLFCNGCWRRFGDTLPVLTGWPSFVLLFLMNVALLCHASAADHEEASSGKGFLLCLFVSAAARNNSKPAVTFCNWCHTCSNGQFVTTAAPFICVFALASFGGVCCIAFPMNVDHSSW